MSTQFRLNGFSPISRLLGWLGLLLLCFTNNAFAAQITLAWDASSGPVAGYHVYYSQQSGSYPATPQQTTSNTTATVSNLSDGAKYYFLVKAYDNNGNLSGPSNEVSKQLDPTPPVVTSPQNGLVAAYGFEETSGNTAVDASGQSNHGTINGATRTAGKFGQALSFNGSSNWVAIPDADSLDLTTSMTLEAWVYPKNLADRRPILAKQGTTNGAPSRGFMLSAGDYSGSGKVETEVFKNESSSSSLISNTALNTSGWQHVALVYQYVADGTSKMTVYINGVASGSNNAAVGSLQKNAQPLDLGRYFYNSSYARYFNGLIDEVRVYNRALNASEIQSDMNNPVAANSSTVQYTFTTQPRGIPLNYGGVSRATPFTVDVTVGSQQTISAPASQKGYSFSAWSDGGAATHTITVDASPKTYTATYVAAIAAPTANFNANLTSGIAPLAINFTDTSAGTVTAWSWNFGDGTTSTDRNPSKTYTKAGNYTVTLTASNSAGSNVASKTSYIKVTDPAPVANFSTSSSNGTAPLLVTFTDASTGNISSRSWDFGNGIASTAQTAMVTYNTPGTYSARLTVTGSGGTNSITKTIVVTAALPVAGFSANPVAGTAPLTTTFTNTSSGTTTSYQWDFGDGSTSTDTYPSHTYAKAGTYTVKLTATGPAGSNIKTKIGYITVARDSGLVAAYGFEETSGNTAVDASGQSNHGTINGATRTAGKFGQALSFNGSSNWVAIPDADSLDLTTSMTLEAWVYPKNLADRRPILAKQGTTNGAPSRGFMLSAGDYSGSGKVETEVFKNESSSSSLISNTALNTSGWQHVALVYQYVADGTSKMTVYINGVASGSNNAAVGSLQKNAQPLDLGRYYWNSGYARYFNGLIDEVRIYNRALSASEIQSDMNKAVEAF
ncbi:MAG: LamG-like jellyroll fold domain-containing protein [Candidatus Contendobacter sp.]|nr:LamG-like jellyroll fold domain-containing protein [Candidatus Contendobacter sp.]